MSRKKKERFAAIKEMDNVYEMDVFGDDRFDKKFFKDDHPIILELGCGKGDYVIEMAEKYPDKNFIGVDIKGDRMYIGAKQALERSLTNVAFIRTFVQFLNKHFDPNSVSEIWITFPDPYPSDTKSRKRLTSPFFLDIYRTILEDEGVLHFKTDDEDLYKFTMETLKEEGAIIDYYIENLYGQNSIRPELAIKTTYEKRHIADGKKIKYIQFRFQARK